MSEIKDGGPSLAKLLLVYQKHGFSFFALPTKKKKPKESWKVWQTRRPTPDEATALLKNGKLQNLAIVTGQVSGIIVLDEDDPPVFQAWMKEHGYSLPPCPSVKTSTFTDDQGTVHTKYHYYFKHPGGKIKNMIRQIPGADIKADGGYVVAPPSVHPSGEQYEWCFGFGLDDYDATQAPSWLLEHLNREVSPEVPLAQGDLLPPDEDWVTRALQGVNRGERNNIAAKLAGYYLAKGEPDPRVLELLRSWNLRNSEAMDDKELQTIVASISRAETRNRIRTGAVQGKVEESGNGVGLPLEEQRQAELQGLGERWGIPLSDLHITHSDESLVEFCLGDDGSVVMTIKDLCEQRVFRSRMASAGLVLPIKIKDKDGSAWDNIVRQVMRLATVQDVGEESSKLGELREFLSSYLENYRGLSYFSANQPIPSHVAFFIIWRKNENPRLYARASSLFMEAKMLGYKTLKQLTILLPSLGHEPEQFRWNRQRVRAWFMELDNMSQDIREMVIKKAADGREREDEK